ncbi:MAG: hypothetical protein M3011_03690 [Actinomycetota bacterium]|nr:hypothetical protein [Actinomycetota bacterium]
MRRILVGPGMIVVTTIVAAVISGCGGGGSTKSTTSPTTAAAGTQAPDKEKFCELIRTYSVRLAALNQPNTTPAQIRSFAQDVGSSMQSAVAIAPAEIKSDTVIVAGAADDFLAALKSVDYDQAKLPPDAAKGFLAPDVVAAAGRFQNYSRDVCGARN